MTAIQAHQQSSIRRRLVDAAAARRRRHGYRAGGARANTGRGFVEGRVRPIGMGVALLSGNQWTLGS